MKNWFHQAWRPALVMFVILVGWEFACRMFQVPSWLLPTPTEIGVEIVQGWRDYHHHVLSTVHLTLVGFVIGVSVGIMVAVMLHLLPKVHQAVYPLMILSQNIPIIVLAPLLVTWFGFDDLPKLIIITLVCFFPIAVNMIDGLKRTDQDLIHYMKMAGAQKRQIFTKLEFPYSLPSMFSGLKISATYSVMGAVISEWLGGNRGIGVYMTLASSSFRTDRVFVAIFIIMVLCMVFFGLILLAEKLLIRSQSSGKEDQS
ncbi:sulfonate/nitrate/taurine ABC transporter permease [Gracilibacillus halophilus YIM-C55.5]|uniref:Sulfonate/nitrate/taurine ABC transporter permease n=1 Tax=Gracilibacillus halophilus YIM-C55.5 TaxID=1308866 RepID=N4WVW4_9BACI|nr:ABC transporter permease [Gracilibacillus halophilus]ENH97231.1 sulfonate/nitrate/taurine ABC transporter permease [Gracilibacillus halophilus YIM-C55.5]